MPTDLLPFLITTVALLASGAVLLIANRQPALLPDTVHPFARPTAPSQDTLAEDALVPTVLRDTGDWKLVTLCRLCDVEELLDCLEANAVAEREVHTFGNDTFAVRWR